MTYNTLPRPRFVATEGKINTLPRPRYTEAETVEKGKLNTLPRGVKAPESGVKLTTIPRSATKEWKPPFIAYSEWQATEKGKLHTLPRGVKAH